MTVTLPCVVIAQQPKRTNWLSLQLVAKLPNQWQWQNDISYRTLGNSVAAFQYLYNTGLKKNINNTWNAGGGLSFYFTRTSSVKSNHEFGKEFRFWQEAAHHIKLSSKTLLQNKLKIEERFFRSTLNSPAFTAIRFRYRVQVSRQLTEKWKMQVNDECMYQWRNTGFSFNQNRLTGNIVYNINEGSQLQAGYTWVKRRASFQHIFSLMFQKSIWWYGRSDHKQ